MGQLAPQPPLSGAFCLNNHNTAGQVLRGEEEAVPGAARLVAQELHRTIQAGVADLALTGIPPW